MAAPKLNTGSSIVDFLKSSGKDSSYSSRAKLAVQYGIVGSTAQYLGDSTQNNALLTAARKGSSPTPTSISSKDDASAFINQNQQDDQTKMRSKDDPPTRSKSASETLTEAYSKVTGKSSLMPDGGKPEAVNFESTYNELRGKHNVGQLETTLNNLDAEEQQVRAQKRERLQSEEDKAVPLNVISGRMGEVERQENKRLESISVQKQGIASQLQTANAVIENTMNLKKLDYASAKDAYDTEFSQNLQLFNVVKGLYDTDVSERERGEDNARANLQIIYNGLKEGNGGEVSETLKTTITRLELEAGLPSGFYERINTSTEKGKILSTTTRTVGGAKFADILTKNADGSLSTKSVRLGATNEGGTSENEPTEAELTRGASSRISGALDPKRGSDGFVSPDDYKAARNAWMTAGFSRKDFDDRFADEFVNPESYGTVGYRPY